MTRQQKGFTIVELMIVLAIGGVILLIVFQAIPTLQRNGRNNQRKQDVAAILEAVSHFELNNSGRMPDNCGGPTDGDECNASGQALANTKLSYYYQPDATSDVKVQIKTLASNTTVSNNTNINSVVVYSYQKCSSSNLGQPTFQAAGSRDIVALFTVETRNGNTHQCQEL